MRTWIEDFRPHMVMFVHSCPEDQMAITVQAVCADRISRVKLRMAIKKAGNDKATLRFLGV